MAEREYYCVDCGRIHVASLWYVRQVNEVGRPLMKTDYLCGEAHSHLGQALLGATRAATTTARATTCRSASPTCGTGSRTRCALDLAIACIDGGQLPPTVRSPRRPEERQNHLPAQIRQLHGLPVEVRKSEAGGRLRGLVRVHLQAGKVG
jgi:hypothetical protein